MSTSRRLAKFVPALALVALAVPSSAFGQATRTWVSGVGDDANPCSRTAPCKTFAGAISKTGPAGEINCLDPGGFGAVTITKSIAIKCRYTEGGLLVSGSNAVIVNAGNGDKVTLDGLDINGVGTPGLAPNSLSGVRVFNAARVNVLNSEIYRFQAGVTVAPTPASANVTRVVLKNNHIHENLVGVFNGPGNNNVTASSVTLRHNDIQDNTCGVTTSAFGPNASTPVAATDCGSAGSGSGINHTAVTSAYWNGINDNGTGMFTRGLNGTAEIAYNDITGNSVFGLHRLDSGHFRTFTPATNAISNNTASDSPDQNSPLTKRRAKSIGR
jgi:hypothetical protein